MVYETLIHTSCNKKNGLTSDINIIATSSAVLCLEELLLVSIS